MPTSPAGSVRNLVHQFENTGIVSLSPKPTPKKHIGVMKDKLGTNEKDLRNNQLKKYQDSPNKRSISDNSLGPRDEGKYNKIDSEKQKHTPRKKLTTDINKSYRPNKFVVTQKSFNSDGPNLEIVLNKKSIQSRLTNVLPTEEICLKKRDFRSDCHEPIHTLKSTVDVERDSDGPVLKYRNLFEERKHGDEKALNGATVQNNNKLDLSVESPRIAKRSHYLASSMIQNSLKREKITTSEDQQATEYDKLLVAQRKQLIKGLKRRFGEGTSIQENSMVTINQHVSDIEKSDGKFIAPEHLIDSNIIHKSCSSTIPPSLDLDLNSDAGIIEDANKKQNRIITTPVNLVVDECMVKKGFDKCSTNQLDDTSFNDCELRCANNIDIVKHATDSNCLMQSNKIHESATSSSDRGEKYEEDKCQRPQIINNFKLCFKKMMDRLYKQKRNKSSSLGEYVRNEEECAEKSEDNKYIACFCNSLRFHAVLSKFKLHKTNRSSQHTHDSTCFNKEKIGRYLLHTKDRFVVVINRAGSWFIKTLIPVVISRGKEVNRFMLRKTDDTLGSMMMIPKGLKMMFRFAISCESGTYLAMMALICSMILEMNPTVPHCTTALNSFVIVLRSCKNDRDIRFYAVSTFLFLTSIAIDVNYLSTGSFHLKLESSRNQVEYGTLPRMVLTRTLMQCLIMVMCVLKLLLLIEITHMSGSGRRLLKKIWNVIYLLLPPLTLEVSSRTNFVIQCKIVIITWIQFICSSVVLLLFIYVNVRLKQSSHFNTVNSVLSLKYLMLLKSSTGYAVIFWILCHSNSLNISKEIGCLPLMISSNSSCKRPLKKERELQEPTNKAIRKLLRSSASIKIIDLFLNVSMWQTISWAIKLGGKYKSGEVRSILHILTFILLFTDVMIIIQGLTAFCFMRLSINEMRFSSHQNLPDDTNSCDYPSSIQDYDLTRHIGTSQEVFERRIVSASNETELPINLSESIDKLDLFVSCKPDEYNRLWNELMHGSCVRFDLLSLKSIKQLKEHFEKRRYYVIASGVSKSNIIKLFLLGQSRGQRCLVEVSIDIKHYVLNLELRSEHKNLLPLFIQSLDIQGILK